jgi:hypothetical protein
MVIEKNKEEELRESYEAGGMKRERNKAEEWRERGIKRKKGERERNKEEEWREL